MKLVFQFLSLSRSYIGAATEFMTLFTAYYPPGGGYGHQNFTPYMHIVVAHVPIFLSLLPEHNIHVFVGEGTEKVSSRGRLINSMSNRRDTIKDIIILEQEMKVTDPFKHKPR